MMTVGTAVRYLDRLAPPELAAEWDNVGLLLGDDAAQVQRVLTCLTVTPEVVTEALESQVQLIVTHHPILFRAVKRLTTTTPEGRMLLGLVRAGVAVYSLHTSFDNTTGGINEMLARRLGLTEVAPLRSKADARSCKIVVFVPDKDLASVSEAMFRAGAGHIGQYSQCSFRLAGTGTFRGSEASHPTVGEKGRLEEVSEWRLEVVCSDSRVEPVLMAMRRAHSYEEPAYDAYPLRPTASSTGEGRIGRLPLPLRLENLARAVKDHFAVGAVATVGDLDRSVERVALACGAGGEFLPDAIRAKADVFLTGEMRFHDYLAAQMQGIALILPGHYATERSGVEELAAHLQTQWPDLQVWASRRESDPIHWIL